MKEEAYQRAGVIRSTIESIRTRIWRVEEDLADRSLVSRFLRPPAQQKIQEIAIADLRDQLRDLEAEFEGL